MKLNTAQKWLEQCTRNVIKRQVSGPDLGALMRGYREKAGASLRSVATEVGISPPYLSDCERGSRKLKADKLQSFVEACDKISAKPMR